MPISLLSSTSQFPHELKAIIRDGDTIERRKKIHDALINNTTREGFKAWAKEHEEFVSRSPIIQQIQQEVIEIEMEEMENADPALLEHRSIRMIAFAVRNYAYNWFNEEQSELRSQIEGNSLEDFFKTNLDNSLLIGEYLETGLISEDDCIEFLKANLFQSKNEFPKFFPILEKLSSERLISLFSKSDNSDIFFQFLKTCSYKKRIQILSANDEYGNTFLNKAEIFKETLLWLQDLSQEECIQVLSIQDKYGNPPLHRKKTFKEAIPFLQGLSQEKLVQVLSIQDKHGNPTFHNEEIFKEADSFLQKLSQEELVQVLSIQDKYGDTLLHKHAEAIPFLWMLSQEKRIQVLSIQNEIGSTPFHGKKIFKKVFLFLLNFSQEERIQILSIKNAQGNTPLHLVDIFKKAISFLLNLSQEERIQILSIKNAHGNTPLHLTDIFKAIPLLENVSKEECLLLLNIQEDRAGKTPLYNKDIFEVATPFLKGLMREERMQLLSHKDNYKESPLHSVINFEESLPLLKFLLENSFEDLIQLLSDKSKHDIPVFFLMGKKVSSSILLAILEKSPDQFFNLLSIKSQEGYTFLHLGGDFENILSLMPKLLKKSPELFFKLLSIQNNDGHTMLATLLNFKLGESLMELLVQQFPEQFLKLLSIKDKEGSTLIHYTKFFENALPLLQSLLKKSPEEVSKLLSTKNDNGDTPWHYHPQIPEVENLIKALNVDLSEFLNKQGLSRLDLKNHLFSEDWVNKPKYDQEEQSFIISANEYAKRAVELNHGYQTQMTQLKTDLHTLWDAVNDEAQKQSTESDLQKRSLIDHYFVIRGKKYTSEEIFNELEKILKLMEDKTGWLGTPPADNVAALYTFYKSQLDDFKKIVEKLKEKNDVYQTVGSITSMIYPRVTEGLCATAYKRAIKQQRVILEEKSGSLTLDGMLDNAIINTFDAIIMEDIIQEKYKGNVHAITQFRHAAGLEAVGEVEAFQLVSFDEAQEMILKEMTLPKFIKKFLQQNNISQETAFEWLKMNTPPNFGAEYHHCSNEMVKGEESLFKACKQQLKFLPVEKKARVLDFFRHSREASLTPLLEHCQSGNQTDMLKALLQRYPQIAQTKLGSEIQNISGDRIDNFKEMFREEIPKLLVQRLQNLSQEEYIKERQELNQAAIEIPNLILAILYFQKVLEPLALSDDKKLQILHVKAFFESEIKKLINLLALKYDIEFSFNSREFSLPSQAVENARRNAYTVPFAGNRATFGVLLAKGILRKT